MAVLSVALLFSVLLCLPAQAKVRHQPNGVPIPCPFWPPIPPFWCPFRNFLPALSSVSDPASANALPLTIPKAFPSMAPPSPLPFSLATAALSPDTIPGLTPNSQTLSQSCCFCPRPSPFFCPHQAPPLHSHVPTPQFLSPALYLTSRPFHGPSPVPWLLNLPQVSVFGSPPAPNRSPWRPWIPIPLPLPCSLYPCSPSAPQGPIQTKPLLSFPRHSWKEPKMISTR